LKKTKEKKKKRGANGKSKKKAERKLFKSKRNSISHTNNKKEEHAPKFVYQNGIN
jgi:hypothetical protein